MTLLRRVFWNKIFYVLFVLLLILGLLFVVIKNREQLLILQQISYSEFIALFLVTLCSFCITSSVSCYLLRKLGFHVPLSENIALTFLANSLNYLGPAQPGLGGKALYFKRMHEISYTDFAIVTSSNALIMLTVSGLSGVLIVCWQWQVNGILLMELGILSVMLTLTMGIFPFVIRLLPHSQEHSGRVIRTINNIRTGFVRFWGQWRSVCEASILVFIQYGIAGLSVKLSYSAVGQSLDYQLAFLIVAFISVANIVPVTPNNLGVTEIIMASVARLAGIDFSVGILAATIMRSFHILMCLGSFPFILWRLKYVK